MTSRTRWALLAALLVAFALTVVVAGQRTEPPPAAGGVQRLGPESGEPVADYLRRAAGSLPAPQAGPVWALLQLDDYLEPPAAAALVDTDRAPGTRLSGVVLRVPLPGVQTALVFRDVPGRRPAAELATALRAGGAERARAAAQAAPGSRAAAVAAVEASRLRAGCACVLALLVRADGAALRALAEGPGVRAVHAADPETPRHGLAVAPLLPEQHQVVGPVPDDGPVPAPPAGRPAQRPRRRDLAR